MIYLIIWLGCIVANFGHQWVTAKDWSLAAERCYFQGAALLVAWIMV